MRDAAGATQPRAPENPTPPGTAGFSIRPARSEDAEVLVNLVHELVALGCYRAQGFLLCRPKPPAELTAILRQGGIDHSILELRDPSPAPAVDSLAGISEILSAVPASS